MICAAIARTPSLFDSREPWSDSARVLWFRIRLLLIGGSLGSIHFGFVPLVVCLGPALRGLLLLLESIHPFFFSALLILGLPLDFFSLRLVRLGDSRIRLGRRLRNCRLFGSRCGSLCLRPCHARGK